jgi:hypothetical protein
MSTLWRGVCPSVPRKGPKHFNICRGRPVFLRQLGPNHFNICRGGRLFPHGLNISTLWRGGGPSGSARRDLNISAFVEGTAFSPYKGSTCQHCGGGGPSFPQTGAKHFNTVEGVARLSPPEGATHFNICRGGRLSPHKGTTCQHCGGPSSGFPRGCFHKRPRAISSSFLVAADVSLTASVSPCQRVSTRCFGILERTVLLVKGRFSGPVDSHNVEGGPPWTSPCQLLCPTWSVPVSPAAYTSRFHSCFGFRAPRNNQINFRRRCFGIRASRIRRVDL